MQITHYSWHQDAACLSASIFLVIEEFAAIFKHQLTYRIIVCLRCAITIPPKHIATYLQKQHPNVRVAQQTTIVYYARQLSSLAWEPRNLQLPTTGTQRISGLKERNNRFACCSNRCGYAYTSIQGIVEHCKKQHNWVNVQKRSRDTRRKAAHPPNYM